MNVQDFQRRAETILAPVAHPRVLSVLALVEETGELAKLVLDHEGYGQPLDAAKLSGEVGDVMVALAEVATRHGVDLEKACAEKLADLEKRVPGWVAKFGPALEKARQRLD